MSEPHLEFFGKLHDKDLFYNDIPLTNFPKNGVMINKKVYSIQNEGKTSQCRLRNQVQMFPTPTTQETEHPGMDMTDTGRRKSKDGKNSHSVNLADTVQMWPTPRAGNPGSRPNKNGGKVLAEEVKKSLAFPTPMASDWKNKDYSRDFTLGNRKYLYPTPTVQDFKHRGPNSSQQGLADVVRYPTPGVTGLSNGSGNCGKINKLYEQGKITEEERRSMRSGNGGQLSPDWVERLMGYPLGYTDAEKENVELADEFPEAWLNNTWEEGVPRVAVGVKNRVSRLKCLGNSVVPQIPKLIWLAVKRYLE